MSLYNCCAANTNGYMNDLQMFTITVQDRIREHEAVKLIRFKDGVLKLSEAYEELGKKCSIVFEAQRDIAHLLPDVHDHDLEEIKYTGTAEPKLRSNLVLNWIKYQLKSIHINLFTQRHTVIPFCGDLI